MAGVWKTNLLRKSDLHFKRRFFSPADSKAEMRLFREETEFVVDGFVYSEDGPFDSIAIEGSRGLRAISAQGAW